MKEPIRGPLNPELQEGDRVVCYHMSGESGVTPGTKGVVRKVQNDPFEPDAKIYSVNWDNGSRLSLLSDTDKWKKIPSDSITESRTNDPLYNLFKRDKDVFKYFDYNYFKDFITKLRDSGIVNMFGSSPLIYAGKDHLERYYGEGNEDNEDFQDLLDMANESRDKLINGVVKYMDANNISLEDLDKVNSLARRFSKSLLEIYMIAMR